MPETYEVWNPEGAEKFAEWFEKRGGVAVWRSQAIGDTSETFTPAETDGKPTGAPSWRLALVEVVTDPRRIRVASKLVEVDRFPVGVRLGSQGMSYKLTDASTEKLKKRIERAKAKHGCEVRYHFDYDNQHAVLEVAVFPEDSSRVSAYKAGLEK